MKIKLKSVRVYGSKEYYGSEPRTSARDEPIILSNYPKKEYRAKVWLGEIPKDVLAAYKVRQGIGKLIISRLAGFKDKNQDDTHRVIEKFIRKKDSKFRVEKWNWFVSFIIEHVVDIKEKFISDNKYVWLEPKIISDYDRDFYKSTQLYLDRLVTYALSFIEPTFFSEICLEGVFFETTGKISFSFPKFTTSADVTVSKTVESLRLSEFESGLRSFSKVPDGSHRLIDKARHWYLISLRESDQWKRFMFSFYALEILTHKVSSKYYNHVCHSLKLKRVNKSEEDKITKTISELVPKKERLNLASKFIIMALKLSPYTASEDLRNFKAAKEARDKLSHGEIKNADELPVQLLFSLLKKYIDILVKG